MATTPQSGVFHSLILLFALALAACAPKTPTTTTVTAPAGPIASAEAGLLSELAIEGPLEARVSKSPASLVLFYGGEQRGSMETCGCPHRPRGSLARVSSYVKASRAANPGVPSLLLNAGEWLTDAVGFQNMPMPQLEVMDRTMAEGLIMGGWDVLNVTPRDVTGLPGVRPSDVSKLPMVSANIEGPHIERSRQFELGGRKYAVTGIAGVEETLSDIAPYKIHPVGDALPFLQSLANDVDGIVLLAFDAAEDAKMFAMRVPKIIAVIDAAGHNQHVEPFYVKNAVWALSFVQTMRLGELRLTLSDGRVTGVDRHIDLDPEIPDDPILAAMQQAARVEIDRLAPQ